MDQIATADQIVTWSVGPPPSLDELEELYEAHYRVALALAHTIVKNRQDAEEAVQEAFLAVWRRRASFDPTRGSQRMWVLKAVRNRALDVLRARKRRPEFEQLEARQHESPIDVEATALATTDTESVLKALGSLSPAQREALELAYFGGLSHTEIAGLLNVPLGTVKGRIRLALDHVRLALEGDGSFVA